MHECLVVVFCHVCSKLTIASVTNARENETFIRDFGVYRACTNVHIGVRIGDLFQTSSRSHDTNNVNLLDTPLSGQSKDKKNKDKMFQFPCIPNHRLHQSRTFLRIETTLIIVLLVATQGSKTYAISTLHFFGKRLKYCTG